MTTELTPSKRRAHNRELALSYARAGMHVMLVKGKASITCAYQRRDTDIPESEQKQIARAFEEKHGFTPALIGSTKSIGKLKALFASEPDALPAICGGPNGLLILDADFKKDRDGSLLIDGPKELRKWIRANRIPEHPITITQSGGEHHFFADALGGHGNVAGLFKEMGVDVRGEGGYVIAQGAVREDGKTYKSFGSVPLPVRFASNDIIDIPEAVEAALSTRVSSATTDEQTEDVKQALHQDDGDADFDPVLGRFDVGHLLDIDPEFRAAWTGEEADGSTTIWRVIRGLRRQYGEAFQAHHALAAIQLSEANLTYIGDDKKTSPGEYSDRDIARAFSKAVNDNVDQSKIVTGSALTAVQDDDDEDIDPLDTTPSKKHMILSTDLVDQTSNFEWVIKGVIPKRGTGIFIADANVGKTGVVMDMAHHIASSDTWAEHRIPHSAPVLYVGGEGMAGIANRLKALRIHYGTLGTFGVMSLDETASLFNAPNVAVKRIMEAVGDLEKATGKKVAMIVLDTLAALSVGMDENSAQDAGVVLGALRKIERKAECFVLAIHHMGKDQTKGARGSSALRGNVDTVLKLEDKKGIITVEIDKQRDGKKGVLSRLMLKTVSLGEDQDGDPITSFVINWEPKKGKATTGKSLGAVEDDDEDVDPLDCTPTKRASTHAAAGSDEVEASPDSQVAAANDNSGWGEQPEQNEQAKRGRGRPSRAEQEGKDAERRQALRAELLTAVRATMREERIDEVPIGDMRGKCGHLDEIMNRGANVSRAIERAYSLGFSVPYEDGHAVVLDDQSSKRLVLLTRGTGKGTTRIFRLIDNPNYNKTPHLAELPDDDAA